MVGPIDTPLHDPRHNDIQHNETQHNRFYSDTLHKNAQFLSAGMLTGTLKIIMLSVILLNVIMLTVIILSVIMPNVKASVHSLNSPSKCFVSLFECNKKNSQWDWLYNFVYYCRKNLRSLILFTNTIFLLNSNKKFEWGIFCLTLDGSTSFGHAEAVF
jgi:hypothetical protein